MTWELDAVPARVDKAAWREVGEEIWVFAADGETVHTLNSVAADVWRACDGQNTVGDIAELILLGYEVDRQTAITDLVECLGALEDQGLIVRS